LSNKVKSHFIIPIFIPHQGCPHRCVFCQQSTITNRSEGIPTADDIGNVIESAIQSRHFPKEKLGEVAFYGGTFTALPNSSMTDMLEAVRPFMRKGVIQSIRVSTRPDALDGDKLDILKSYDVSTVELGIQSMDDHVLYLSRRGHTSGDTVNGFATLRRRGFKVGAQLMPGLPGDTSEIFLETVTKVIALRPDMARLYPTLVIRDTKLAQWYYQGKYTPMQLEDTINLCKEACMRFENAGIPVIRIGLMSSPSLLRRGEIVAGPWHPSLGFLVRSAIHLAKLTPYLPTFSEPKTIILHAPRDEIPLIMGYRKSGKKTIEALTGGIVGKIVPDGSIPLGKISVTTL
jgi:histone acetyltransferase (RNA polymerase elongator complex component)